MLSEGGVLEVADQRWVEVTELGQAVSEAFALGDRHERQIVVLSALLVASIMSLLVERCQEGAFLPGEVVLCQRVVLSFLNTKKLEKVLTLLAS